MPVANVPPQRARRIACSATLLLALAGCGGGAAPEPPPEGPRAQALAVSQPGELLNYMRTKLRAARSASTGGSGTGALAPVLAVADSGSSSGSATLFAGTTVQETGVDEDDLVKTDGQRIYTLDPSRGGMDGSRPARVQAWLRQSDGSLQAGGSVDLSLPAATPGEQRSQVSHGLLLADPARRLVALSESVSYSSLPLEPCVNCAGAAVMPPWYVADSSVQVQALQAPANGSLAAGDLLSISGRLVASRLIGQTLVLATTYAPRTGLETLPYNATPAQLDAALAALRTEQLLPTLRVNGGPAQPLLADTDCWLQPANASPGVELTTITLIDLASPSLARSSRCFAGGAEALYLSTNALYLATTRFSYTSSSTGKVLRYEPNVSTDLHKFALQGQTVDYRASGSVAGHLGWDGDRKRYRLSEHQGLLRVVSFTGSFGWASPADMGAVPPSPATLSVLREDAGTRTLALVGQLPNAQRPAPLGHAGEQIHGVRLVGERGYVVTFRQTDPLYVLDLSDPADPRAAGELQMPGFSDWLYPLPDGLLLGVGRDADANGSTGGVKVALMDVRDPASPQLLASQVFGARWSSSGLDAGAHGIVLMNTGNTTRVALPLLLYGSDGSSPPTRGLQRLEVDRAARSLRSKGLISGAADPAYSLFTERSLLMDEQLYYFSGGALSRNDW